MSAPSMSRHRAAAAARALHPGSGPGFRAAAAACTLVLAAASPALADAPRYTAIDLGPGPNTLGGMTAGGDYLDTAVPEAVGSAPLPPLLYSAGGGVTDLQAPGGSAGYAFAHNNTGTVVGQIHPGGAARWTPSGVTVLADLSPSIDSAAMAVNDAGLIVGYSSLAARGPTRAVVWTSDGGVTELGSLGGRSAMALGVNSAGTIVGFSTTSGTGDYRAVVWRPGSTDAEDLGTLGGNSGWANGVNDAGWIVGNSQLPPGEGSAPGAARATLWKDGAVINLGAPAGAVRSDALSINSAGDILGTYTGTVGSSSTPLAFLYSDGVMYKLSTLLDPALNIVNPRVTSQAEINDAGWFVGTGTVNGERRRFLFLPVPEPGAAGLAALTLTGALLSRRRLSPGSARLT